MSLALYYYELGTNYSEAVRQRLDKKYGRSGWRFYSPFKETYSLGSVDAGLCFSCHSKAVERIEANVWGHVVEYDMCAAHARQYKDKNIDAPERRQETKAVNA